ncbi:hypothetical protein HKD37_05G014433 [Glycine soja]
MITNELRVKRHMTDESLTHTLRDCQNVKELEAVHMVEGIKNVPNSLRPLIPKIRRMLQANGWQNSLLHINREANSATDWVAKFGHQRNWSSLWMSYLML